MSVLDEFLKNYEDLLLSSYESGRDWPIVIRRKTASGSGIFPRNSEAYRELEEINQELWFLNRRILKFFGVDQALLGGNGKRKRGRPRKIR